MGSVGSERKRLHRDLFERGVASDNCGDDGDNDDDFSCRTDLTTVQASNVRRDTVRSAPNVAIDADLTSILEELVAPLHHNSCRQGVLYVIRSFAFGKHRSTGETLRERLRLQYQVFDVTGDAVPQDAIGRLIELRMGRHARAVELIDIMLAAMRAAMLARPRMIAVHEQQDENDSGLPAASVPGHPAAGAVADAQVGFPHDNDVIDDNTEGNTAARVRRESDEGGPPL